MPLSVSVWMTQPESARIKIVPESRPPLGVLLELRRLTTTCLSSLFSNVSDGGCDAAKSDKGTTTVRGAKRNSVTTTTGPSTRTSDTTVGSVDRSTGEFNPRGGGQ